MNSIVSVASVASASAIPAPSDAFVNPDAELIALADQMPALVEAHKKADVEADRIEQVYFARRPGRPAELRWRLADPVGFWPARVGEPVGSIWCNEDEIEGLRHKPILHREFIGTDEDWASLPGGENGPLTQAELAQWDAFYKYVPDERGQARFNEIIAAYDKHEAAIAALKLELGYDAAEKTEHLLWERCRDILDKIVAISAHSIEGLRAKAHAADTWWWRGDLESDHDGCDEPVLKSIARDLLPLPSGAAIIPSPAVRTSDPIFAAIEAHRRAWQVLEAAVREEGDLDEQLPVEKREWHWHVTDRSPPSNCQDDPRWIAVQLRTQELSDQEDERAAELLETEPTTVEGVAAILAYTAEFEDNGCEWNSYDEGSWHCLLNKMLAATLPKIAAGHAVARAA